MSEKQYAKKILVADDSLTIQKVIRLALSGDGYEIQTVSDGKEALEQASLFRPDIFIIDVSLPIFDAYQVREHLIQRPDLKNIPVILMSSAFEKVDDTRSKQLGFAGHLIKPFDPSHLRSTLLSVSNFTPANDPVMATINEPYRPPNDLLGLNLPPLTSGGYNDDIQELAKNTFEMSGLDQQEWGMVEPGLAPQPGRFEKNASEVSGFEMDPIASDNVAYADGFSDSSSQQSPHQFTISSHELEAMIKMEVAKTLEKMHGSIQERIQQEVFLFNQQHLPALAEKLLKEEIHKLLSDPPV
jgi:CheY-like chemotaxis protein